MKLLMSILILIGGFGCAWFYLRKPTATPALPAVPEDSPLRMLGADRPWRRVGAAICLVLSIMFVLGIYLVDIPQHPKTYAAFWLVIMAMVVWLCVLAVKDALYTRRIIAKWQAGKRAMLDARRAGVGDGSGTLQETGSQESQS